MEAIGTIGNEGRDNFHGPGINNTDLDLAKRIYLGAENRRWLEMRVDAFNAFNHTQFSATSVTSSINSANFGRVLVRSYSANHPVGSQILLLKTGSQPDCSQRISYVSPIAHCSAAFLFALALFAPSASLLGQTETTGDVVGTVTDSSGAVVPGISVTLRSLGTNEVRTEVTKAAGEYRFALLQPGDYQISAEHGSLKSSIEKFTVLLGQEEQMNLRVTVQGTQQVVQVTTEATALETENANLTTSIDTKQVNDLPASGGDITQCRLHRPGRPRKCRRR